MGNDRELAQNLLNAAIAFNDAQEAEYAPGEPAHSEAASARTRAAGLNLEQAYEQCIPNRDNRRVSDFSYVFTDSQGNTWSGQGPSRYVEFLPPDRENLTRAGLTEHEIDFIATQMVQLPFELYSNTQEQSRKISDTRVGLSQEYDERAGTAGLAIHQLTKGPPLLALGAAPPLSIVKLRDELEAELRAARVLAPSDSAVNTNSVMKSTLGNTLEYQTLVETTPSGPRIS